MMFRIMLLDDERLALLHLEKLLKDLDDNYKISGYTQTDKALEYARTWQPDVIFLDIHMPEMSGLAVSEIVKELLPDVEVVFVTAYDQYAIEAFEQNALDYVLKPVEQKRLAKTMRRLADRRSRMTEKEIPVFETIIHCFSSLRFERGGAPLPLRWRTAKAQELFAYLLHHRDQFVSKDTLIEVLWPDFDWKKAATHLYTTVYQVRQSLKQEQISITISNVSKGEGYLLSAQSVLIDSEEWERDIRELGAVNLYNYKECQRLCDLYLGDYLADYDYMWAERARQRLRTVWLYHVMGLAEFYVGERMYVEAVTAYQRVIQLQPYFEEGHLGLMKVYALMGERTAVEKQYRSLEALLKDELHLGLPERVSGWYEKWRQMNLRAL